MSDNSLVINLHVEGSSRRNEIISWTLDQGIFTDKIFLSNEHTGTSRSPFNANEFVVSQSDSAMATFHTGRNYQLKITQSEIQPENLYFVRPRLCYMSIRLISRPWMNMNNYRPKFLGQRGTGACSHMTLAPDGAIYLMSTCPDHSTIHIPNGLSIQGSFLDNEVIPYFLEEGAVLSYSIVFSVEPTLLGLQQIAKDAISNGMNEFGVNDDSIIFENVNDTRTITPGKVKYFLKKIKRRRIEKFLHRHRKKSPDIVAVLTALLESINNEGSYQKVLGAWAWNKELCFRIDPLARVSSSGSQP